MGRHPLFLLCTRKQRPPAASPLLSWPPAANTLSPLCLRQQDKKKAEEERAKELAALFAQSIKQPKVPIGAPTSRGGGSGAVGHGRASQCS